MFLLELKPTLKCNQTCYYCNIHEKSKFKDNDPIVDTDYVRYVLTCHRNADLFLQISGGEVGLLSNLSEFFEVLYNFPKVVNINIESNGLLRKIGFDFNGFRNIFYFEHLIFDINGRDVNTFYDLDFEKITRNHKFVIVSTEKTIDSILNNFDYFKDNGFFEERFWFKIIVPKSYTINFTKKLKNFYKRLNDYQNYTWELFRLDNQIGKKDCKSFRNFCAINPPQPFVDFEKKQLVHCGVVSEIAKRFSFTAENAELNMKCSLFSFEEYCKNCYVYDYSENKIDCILRSKRGDYCNRSYINV
jgi:hypothetical protein